jgi:hypothetical protein
MKILISLFLVIALSANLYSAPIFSDFTDQQKKSVVDFSEKYNIVGISKEVGEKYRGDIVAFEIDGKSVEPTLIARITENKLITKKGADNIKGMLLMNDIFSGKQYHVFYFGNSLLLVSSGDVKDLVYGNFDEGKVVGIRAVVK